MSSSRISVDPPPTTIAAPPPEPVKAPPASPAPQPPPEGETAPEASGEAPEGQQPEAKPEIPPEVQKRLDRLKWEKAESDRRYAALQAQIAEDQRKREQAAKPPGERDQREAYRQEFMNEQAQGQFNAACNDLFHKGRAEYGEEMEDAVRLLNAVGYGERPDALAAITSLPDGHKVYRQLASNPDNAARILALPPMGMMLELARMGASVGATGIVAPAPSTTTTVPVTQAPEPLKPIGGNAQRADKPLDQVSMAEFIRRRDKEETRSRILR